MGVSGIWIECVHLFPEALYLVLSRAWRLVSPNTSEKLLSIPPIV